MDRKEFFKKACVLGICSCAGLSLLSASENMVDNIENTNEDPDWRIGFMQTRFAKLMNTLCVNVDESTRTRIIEEMGRECARQAGERNKKYIGNIEAFLKDMESGWAEKATYDKAKNEIKIIGKKTDKCFCPFVDKSNTPKDFCNCSIGWQKENVKYLIGKEVTAQIDGSVLRGDSCCSFTIKIR